MEILVVALIVAAAVAGFCYSHYLKEQRRHSLQKFAGKHGFSFSRRDPFGLLTRPFELFSKGDKRGCENLVWGDWKGLEIIAADYWYYTESSDSKGRRSKTYHRFSVAVVDLELFAPHIVIRPENLLTRLADHVGFRDIDFESEEFNRRFQVQATSREFAYKLVDARVMRWLLSTRGRYGFEISSGGFLVQARKVPAAGLFPLMGTAKELHERIPRLVWNDYGPGNRVRSVSEEGR